MMKDKETKLGREMRKTVFPEEIQELKASLCNLVILPTCPQKNSPDMDNKYK